MSGGIQSQVFVQPAPAVAGDFASSNPRATFLAGPGGLVAGLSGATIANFCWVTWNTIDADYAPATVNSFGYGPVAGFLHREQQGLITAFLADATFQIPSGFPVTVSTAGDFWIKNSGTTAAYPGMYAYANFSTGTASFQSGTSSPAGNVTAATSSIAASTFSVTGSITNNVLNVTGVTSGTVVAGATISGTGIATGTQIVAQLSGTTGGVGTYALNIGEQTAASTTVSGTYGTLTLGAAPSGAIVIGSVVTGTGISVTTNATQLLTGTGGNGSTFAVNVNTVVSSTTLTFQSQIATKWIAQSTAAAGELVKISSWVLN